MTSIVMPCRNFIRLTLPRRFRRPQAHIWRCSRPAGHEGAHRDDVAEWENLGTPGAETASASARFFHEAAAASARVIRVNTELSEADYERLAEEFLGQLRKKVIRGREQTEDD